MKCNDYERSYTFYTPMRENILRRIENRHQNQQGIPPRGNINCKSRVQESLQKISLRVNSQKVSRRRIPVVNENYRYFPFIYAQNADKLKDYIKPMEAQGVPIRRATSPNVFRGLYKPF